MNKITAIIAENNSALKQELHNVLSENRHFEVKSLVTSPSALLEALKEHRPTVLYLSTTMEDSTTNAYELCRKVLNLYPTLIVMFVSPSLEEAVDMRQAMSVGGRYIFVEGDFRKNLVTQTVEIVMQVKQTFNQMQPSSEQQKTHIISFVSPKAGAGTTSIAINYATELSQMVHPTGRKNRVLLIDLNMHYGDVAYLANVKAQNTLESLYGKKSIDVDSLSSLYVESPYGFTVLPASDNLQTDKELSVSIFESILEISSTSFDYILIDSNEGITEMSLPVLQFSDSLIFVSQAKLIDIKNLMAMCSTMLNLANMLEIPNDEFLKKSALLLNKTNRYSIPHEEVEKKIRMKVLGRIPSDENLATLASYKKENTMKDSPKSALAVETRKSLYAVLQRIHPSALTQGGGKMEVKTNGLWNLWGFLK